MMVTMMTTKTVAYTLTEAARYLGVSPTHVARWLNEGLLEETHVVAGTGRYITAESVESLRRAREAE